MPSELDCYPGDWPQLSSSIKEEAGWMCEKYDKVCRRTAAKLTEYIKRSGYPTVDMLMHRLQFTLDCTQSNIILKFSATIVSVHES